MSRILNEVKERVFRYDKDMPENNDLTLIVQKGIILLKSASFGTSDRSE